MSRSALKVTKILFLSGALMASGLFLKTAQASDPADVERLKATRSCALCDLSGEDLSGAMLQKSDLSGANLSTAKLYKADLTGANLKGTNFTGTDLSGANLTGATDANLSGAKTDGKTTCTDGTAGPCK